MTFRDEGETPGMTQIIEELIEDRLYSLNTFMPGTIKKVDKVRGLVAVQPDFMRVWADDDEPSEYPIIEGVPLWELRAGEARINMPVKVDGKCMIVFSQRALERWKLTGDKTRPGDTRLHHLSDAICIPGLYPIKDAKPLSDELSIEFGKASISFKDSETITAKVVSGILMMNKDGKFKISNGSSELLTLIKEFMIQEEAIVDAVQKMTFPTSLGPSGTVIDPMPFSQAMQEMAKIRKKLTQLILE